MTCKSGMNQYLVEKIVESILFKYLNDGTLQAGLQACGAQCDTFLGKGTNVVTCEQLPTQICEALKDGLNCLPLIESFLLTGTVLSLNTTDGQEFSVDLSGLLNNTDTYVTAFTVLPDGVTLRISMNNSTVFDVDLSSFKLTAAQLNTFIQNSATIKNTIASVFNTCAGTPHSSGDLIPTCAEMNQAIDTASAQIKTQYTTCAGVPHPKNSSIPTCQEMSNAISEAQAAVPAVFNTCAGTPHEAGDTIPTCDEMSAAIAAAITAAIDALPPATIGTSLQRVNIGQATLPAPVYAQIYTPVLLPIVFGGVDTHVPPVPYKDTPLANYTINSDGTLTFTAKEMLVQVAVSTHFQASATGAVMGAIVLSNPDATLGRFTAGGDTIPKYETGYQSNSIELGPMSGWSAAVQSGTSFAVNGTLMLRITPDMTVSQRTFGLYGLLGLYGGPTSPAVGGIINAVGMSQRSNLPTLAISVIG